MIRSLLELKLMRNQIVAGLILRVASVMQSDDVFYKNVAAFQNTQGGFYNRRLKRIGWNGDASLSLNTFETNLATNLH